MTEAFKLMLTGMSTVFLILIFVVLLGHLIIMVSNKLNSKVVSVGATNNNKIISSPKMAAIIAAVEVATQGNGNINSINKIEEK